MFSEMDVSSHHSPVRVHQEETGNIPFRAPVYVCLDALIAHLVDLRANSRSPVAIGALERTAAVGFEEAHCVKRFVRENDGLERRRNLIEVNDAILRLGGDQFTRFVKTKSCNAVIIRIATDHLTKVLAKSLLTFSVAKDDVRTLWREILFALVHYLWATQHDARIRLYL